MKNKNNKNKQFTWQTDYVDRRVYPVLHQLYDTFRIHCSDFVNRLSVYLTEPVESDSMVRRVEPDVMFLQQPTDDELKC